MSCLARSLGTFADTCLLGFSLLAAIGMPGTLAVQSSISSQAGTDSVLLYSPASNLERSEVEMLRRAKVSVDIAMYSFTDRELAEELLGLPAAGFGFASTATAASTGRRASVISQRPRPSGNRCSGQGKRGSTEDKVSLAVVRAAPQKGQERTTLNFRAAPIATTINLFEQEKAVDRPQIVDTHTEK